MDWSGPQFDACRVRQYFEQKQLYEAGLPASVLRSSGSLQEASGCTFHRVRSIVFVMAAPAWR